jgi:hypothetical protein
MTLESDMTDQERMMKVDDLMAKYKIGYREGFDEAKKTIARAFMLMYELHGDAPIPPTEIISAINKMAYE